MKFSDYQTIWHLCISIFAFNVISSDYYEDPPIDPEFEIGIQMLYMLSFSYHVGLYMFDPASKRMHLIRVHHITTLILISYSWYANYVAFGAIIMLINDITDVPMFILRNSRKNKSSEIVQYISAFIVIVSWILLRIIYLGYLIIIVFSINIWVAFFLWVLWCLNVYWVYLVISKSIYILLGYNVTLENE
jgi:hypothetical protein